MIPVVRERVEIIVHPATKKYRLIDFDIRLRALVSGIRIGGSEDAKGYGGFSPRIKLQRDQRFIASVGEVEPTVKAISDAGAWINITGNQSGVAIVAHDSNPAANHRDGDQPSWILRRQRSMQNAVYPGREAVEVSTQQPTRLRYRLIIHDGTLTSDRVSAIAADYRDGTR
jgi:hypothetical protein